MGIAAIGLAALKLYGIPAAVRLVEKMFGSGGGKDIKLPAVLEQILPLVKRLQEPGVGLPEVPEITSWIEEVVKVLNAKGELKGHDTVVALPTLESRIFSIGSRMVLDGIELIDRSGVTKQHDLMSKIPIDTKGL